MDRKTFAAKGYERTVEGEENVVVVVAQIYIFVKSQKKNKLHTKVIVCNLYLNKVSFFKEF